MVLLRLVMSSKMRMVTMKFVVNLTIHVMAPTSKTTYKVPIDDHGRKESRTASPVGQLVDSRIVSPERTKNKRVATESNDGQEPINPQGTKRKTNPTKSTPQDKDQQQDNTSQQKEKANTSGEGGVGAAAKSGDENNDDGGGKIGTGEATTKKTMQNSVDHMWNPGAIRPDTQTVVQTNVQKVRSLTKKAPKHGLSREYNHILHFFPLPCGCVAIVGMNKTGKNCFFGRVVATHFGEGDETADTFNIKHVMNLRHQSDEHDYTGWS